MARRFKGNVNVENNLTVDNGLTLTALNVSRALVIDASGNVSSSATTNTEVGFLSGVTSSVQTQLNDKAEDADVVKRDGSQDFTADQSMGLNKLTNLAAPTNDNDAARKIDVDAASAGQLPKAPVDLVSTSNITLSGEQTIDGVLTSASRVLVAGQSSSSDNGIYISGAGAWTRATDFDGAPNGEVARGNIVFVISGTSNSNTNYILNNTNASDPTQINVGTETNEWVIYSRAEATQAGDGLDKSGLTFSVDASDIAGAGIEEDGSNNLRIAASAAGTGLTGGAGSALEIDFGTSGQQAVAASVLGSANNGEGASLIGVEDASANFTATDVEGVLSELQGNINNKQDDVITTEGDLVIGNVSGEESRLGIGSNGTVLQSNGTTASWQTLSTTDELVKVSANDTTAKYLEDAIVVASGVNATNPLEISTLNDGSDEDFQIQFDETKVDHDNLSGFVANEHIDHSSVTLTAGAGLSGGGDITTSRTFDVDINSSIDKATPVAADEILLSDSEDSNNIKKADIQSLSSAIDHDSTNGFVANEHIDHSSVEVATASDSGLSGGGDLTASRNLSVDINGTTAESSIEDSDEILIYDSSAGVLRKATRSDFLNGTSGSAGDIAETSFAIANNQVTAADVTGFVFANATVRSFHAHVSVEIDATANLYENFFILGIQKDSSWDLDVSSMSDDSQIVFSITASGQVQYTSANYSGFSSGLIKFRAQTTTV